MDYKAFIFICICLLIVRVESVTFWNNSLQRRFMWKQMDETVEDLMDGVMSGARVMKNMLGELLPSAASSSSVRHVNHPYDYLPSETTRVKYIIRSPTGKVMKTIKLRPPKKTIKVMAIPKVKIAGKYYKPKMKYPNAEEMRKLEKQQERIVEGKVPKQSSEEVLAEIQSEKQMKDLKKDSKKPTKISQELKAEQEAERETEREAERETEREAEKQLTDQKLTDQRLTKTHAQQEKPQKFQIPRPEKQNTADQDTDVVSGHIQEFDDEWLPVQYIPEYHQEVKLPAPFSTIKPYPLSHLHTLITNSWPTKPSYQAPHKSRPLSKLHTSIIDSRRPQTWVEKPVYEEPQEDDQHLYNDPPKKMHTYEVTEYIPEESRALPLQQEYFQTKARNLAYEIAAEASVKQKFAAARAAALHSSSTSSTTTTSSTVSTTTEEPNYPAEFLRKYRERTAAAVSPKTTLHYRSNDKLLDDTSWIPSSRNRSYAPALKAPRNSSKRTKSENWPPEEPTSKTFGTEAAAASVVVESSAQIQVETTPQPTRTRRRKQMRFITPIPESDEVSEGSDSIKSKPRAMRQRGSVRFGDKLNLDEY